MLRDQPDNERHAHRLAVLLSGSGRTLENLFRQIDAGALQASVELVISTRANVRGVDVAQRAGIPVCVVKRSQFDSTVAFSNELFEIVRGVHPELVVCAGFLSKIDVPADFEGRIVNIHPSLLPLFGGKGFYGTRIHQAVLESGMKVTGCTVHFVDNEYDAGPIISQHCVPVLSDDSAEALAARVFNAECELYPRVIADILAGRVQLAGGLVRYDMSIGDP